MRINSFIITVIFALLLISCSSADTAKYTLPEYPSLEDTIKERNNTPTNQLTFTKGEYIGGKDIPVGRYRISGENFGLIKLESKDCFHFSDYINDGTTGLKAGVRDITLDIIKDDHIEIGLDTAYFSPVKTDLESTLSAGIWIVGLDIPEGEYIATCKDGESGNLMIYPNPALSKTHVILNRTGKSKETVKNDVEEVDITLSERDRVYILGLSEVILIPKNSIDALSMLEHASNSLEPPTGSLVSGLTIESFEKRYNSLIEIDPDRNAFSLTKLTATSLENNNNSNNNTYNAIGAVGTSDKNIIFTFEVNSITKNISQIIITNQNNNASDTEFGFEIAVQTVDNKLSKSDAVSVIRQLADAAQETGYCSTILNGIEYTYGIPSIALETDDGILFTIAHADQTSEPVNTPTSTSTNTTIPNIETQWNTTDPDAFENGNIFIAVELLVNQKITIDEAEYIDPALLIKAPWKYYGKYITVFGTVAVIEDYPTGSDISASLQCKDVSDIVIITEDSTIVEVFLRSSSGNLKADDDVKFYGYVVGRTEVENKLGGKYTHLIMVGDIIE